MVKTLVTYALVGIFVLAFTFFASTIVFDYFDFPNADTSWMDADDPDDPAPPPSTHANATPGTPTPSWLWTREGCVHLETADIEKFLAEINAEDGGCPHDDAEKYRHYSCADTANFYFFLYQSDCQRVLEKFKEWEEQQKNTPQSGT